MNVKKCSYERSLQYKNPELAKEWHPTKNGDITPDSIGVGSRYEAWWFLPYDDLKTGKHFDFVWQARVDNRYNQRLKGKGGCPYLSNEAVWPGFNDLATFYPDIAKEWDYDKNKGILNREKVQATPYNVGPYSNIVFWWRIFYEKDNGEIQPLSWDASVDSRTREDGGGCPYIGFCPKRILKGFNDLATTNPDLVKQWSPKNALKPDEISKGSNKKVWWIYPHDDLRTGKHFDFEWETSINHRNPDGRDNPYLSNKKVWIGFNDLQSTFPEIAKEWDYEKNILTPEQVTYASCKNYYWSKECINPLNNEKTIHSWQQTPFERTMEGKGCPLEGSNQYALKKGHNDLKTLFPELTKEWNYERNVGINPEDFLPGSLKKVWWIKEVEDDLGNKMLFEWKSIIFQRVKDNVCPYSKYSKLQKRVSSILCELAEDYEVEYKVEGLKRKKSLLFDIRLQNGSFIEVDGTQHFEKKFNISENDFLKIVESDNMKNEYCYSNNIPLLRIPYIYNNKPREELKEIIIQFVDNGSVPNIIKSFYLEKTFSVYSKLL